MSYLDRDCCAAPTNENVPRAAGLVEQLVIIDEILSKTIDMARVAEKSLTGSIDERAETRAQATCMVDEVGIIKEKVFELSARMENILKVFG